MTMYAPVLHGDEATPLPGAAAFLHAPVLLRPHDDHQLLRNYLEGDQRAFAQLVERHSGWIYHVCRRNLGDAHHAEDATQAVFLLLSRKAKSIKAQVHLAGWLFQACRYVLADLRKHQARYRRRLDLATEMASNRLAESESSAELPLELSAALDEAIAVLREGDRQVVLMHFYEGLTVQQIATQLDLSQEAAKKRLNRAMVRLREQLAKQVKVLGRKTGTALSVGAVLALLHASGTQAAPVGLASAIAKAVTIPGFSSALAEMIASGVHQATVHATGKLLATLALGATPLVVALSVVPVIRPIPIHSATKPTSYAFISPAQTGGGLSAPAATAVSARQLFSPNRYSGRPALIISQPETFPYQLQQSSITPLNSSNAVATAVAPVPSRAGLDSSNYSSGRRFPDSSDFTHIATVISHPTPNPSRPSASEFGTRGKSDHDGDELFPSMPPHDGDFPPMAVSEPPPGDDIDMLDHPLDDSFAHRSPDSWGGLPDAMGSRRDGFGQAFASMPGRYGMFDGQRMQWPTDMQHAVMRANYPGDGSEPPAPYDGNDLADNAGSSPPDAPAQFPHDPHLPRLGYGLLDSNSGLVTRPTRLDGRPTLLEDNENCYRQFPFPPMGDDQLVSASGPDFTPPFHSLLPVDLLASNQHHSSQFSAPPFRSPIQRATLAPTATSGAVPEPASAGIVFTVGIFALGRRNR